MRTAELIAILVIKGAERPSGSGSKPKLAREGEYLTCMFLVLALVYLIGRKNRIVQACKAGHGGSRRMMHFGIKNLRCNLYAAREIHGPEGSGNRNLPAMPISMQIRFLQLAWREPGTEPV
jgi:hypothetical protein